MTIKDIAEKSGYSITTVSRVINKGGNVSPKAYAAIMEIVNQYNFMPNQNARQLKQTVGDQIALIVKGHSNMVFAGILERVQQMFTGEKYTLNVHYIDEDANEVDYATRLMREQKPIALYFLGGNLEYFSVGFSQILVPSVLVTTTASNLNIVNLSSVFTDDISAANHAVNYLINCGHKKIGILGGNIKTSHISQLRYLGCLQSFNWHNIPFDFDSQYQKARFSFEDGYNSAAKLLEKSPHLTAIFTMSDVMAIGAIRRIIDMGKKVPEDISVVGFDGIDIAGYYNPKITTIQQNLDKLAQRSVVVLLDQLKHDRPSIHETIAFKLLEGESVIKI